MSAAGTQPADIDPVENRRRWQALGVGLVAAFMTLLDVSIVNVAVPTGHSTRRPVTSSGFSPGTR